MPRNNYRGISNLPPRRPPLHSQVDLQCSFSYSRWRCRAQHGEGTRETLGSQGSRPFQVIGVDFAGPIRYTLRAKTESKAYLALYA